MDAFAELRAHLQQLTPSEAHWKRIRKMVHRAHRKRPGEVADQWVPYINSYLRSWPDRLRETPQDWALRMVAGEELAPLDICRHLDIRARSMTDEHVETFRAHPQRDNFTSFAVTVASDERFWSGGWPALRALSFHALHEAELHLLPVGAFASLEHLVFEQVAVWEDGESTLAPTLVRFLTSAWPALHTLELTATVLRDEGLEALTPRRYPALRRLNLSNNPLGLGAIEAVCRLEGVRVLELRDLRSARPGAGYGDRTNVLQDHPDVLRELPAGLEVLDLSLNYLDAPALEAIAASPAAETLRVLCVSSPLRWHQRFIPLAALNALELPQLRTLVTSAFDLAHLPDEARAALASELNIREVALASYGANLFITPPWQE